MNHFFLISMRNNFCKILSVGLCILFTAVLFSCKKNPFGETEKPIAEVSGKYLYKKDIPNIFSAFVSKEDSLAIVEKFIKDRATDILLYEKAQQNVEEDDNIKQLIENYRRSLLTYKYQLELVKSRVSNTVSEDEMKAYYDKNPPLFELNETLVKGLLLIVPNKAPDLHKLRSLADKPKDEDLDAIESLSIKNSAKFDYFSDRWLPLLEIQRKSPFMFENNNIPKQQSFFESADSTSTYFFYVEDYIPEGGRQPYEYAENRIRDIILEQRKNNYLKQFEDKLYEDGIKKGSVKLY